MAFSESRLFMDRDGLSNDMIFQAAARRELPPPPKPSAPVPAPLTMEERISKLEEKNTVSGQTTKQDPWSDPEYWGFQQPQQQAPQQQQQSKLVVPTPQQQQEIGKLPQSQAELEAVVRQQTQQVVGSLIQSGQQVQNRLNQMREKFLGSKEHAPWYPAAEQAFLTATQSGQNIEDAYKTAVAHVQYLHSTGHRPPENLRSGVPSPSGAGAGGGYGNLNGNQLRPDEDPSIRITHYSEEQKRADRDVWLKKLEEDQEYRRTQGDMGTSLRDSMPEAFER